MDEKKHLQPETDTKGYRLTFSEDGIFLQVFPRNNDEVLFELKDITKTLEDRGVMDYPIDLIAKTMRESTGEEIEIVKGNHQIPVNSENDEAAEAEAEVVELKEPSITIHISKDRMEGTLSIDSDFTTKKPTVEMVMDKLAEKNVVYGIDEAAIKEAVGAGKAEVVIAKGQRPVNGENAQIIKSKSLDNKGKPVELENGRVDFKNLNVFIIVKEGDLLAERIPHTMGVVGTDIHGQTVAAKPGKPAMLPVGKNTKIIEEHKLISLIDGQLSISGNKISVLPTIEIKGNVDLSTGNIDFIGSVIVRGSVQPGFSIKATGDIEIYGTISGGTVEGKNVIIKAGIQGMQRGYIKAEEDIKSSFAENANLIAGRDTIISEAILHSNIRAGKRVVTQGRRGIIAGGVIVAGEEILVKYAGNQMDTVTRLEVGINPMLKDEYKDIKQALGKAETELEQAQKSLALLKSINPTVLSTAKRELLLKLTKAQFPLAGEVKRLRDRLIEIENAFEELKSGKIKVTEKVYPGVKMIIGSVMKNITSPIQHSRFYEEDNEIKVGPL